MTPPFLIELYRVIQGLHHQAYPKQSLNEKVQMIKSVFQIHQDHGRFLTLPSLVGCNKVSLTELHLPSMVGSDLTELRSVHSIFSWFPSCEVSTELVDDSLSISSTSVLKH